MVLGVTLGVAVVIAIDLANTSARRGFQRSTEAVTGRATHQVLGGPSGLPQDVFRRIRVEAGLRASTPVVEGFATALDLDRQPLHVLGLDLLSEAPFRDHLGGGSLADPGLARVFVDPKAVVIGSALAGRYGLAPRQPPAPAGAGPDRGPGGGGHHARRHRRREGRPRVGRADGRGRGAAALRHGRPPVARGPDRVRGRRRPRRRPPPGRRPRRAGERAGLDGRPVHGRLRAQPHGAQHAGARRGHVPHLQHGHVQRRAAARRDRHPAPPRRDRVAGLLARPARDGGGGGRGNAPRPRPRLAARPGRRPPRHADGQRPLLRALRVGRAPHALHRREGRRPRPRGRCPRGRGPGPRGRPRRAGRGAPPQLFREPRPPARPARRRGRRRRLGPRRPAARGLGPLARRELRGSLRDRPRPRPPRSSGDRRRDGRRHSSRRPSRRHARTAGDAHGHPLGEPHRRRRRGPGRGRVGVDRGRPDDRELPVDRRELARPHPARRRVRRGARGRGCPRLPDDLARRRPEARRDPGRRVGRDLPLRAGGEPARRGEPGRRRPPPPPATRGSTAPRRETPRGRGRRRRRVR